MSFPALPSPSAAWPRLFHNRVWGAWMRSGQDAFLPILPNLLGLPQDSPVFGFDFLTMIFNIISYIRNLSVCQVKQIPDQPGRPVRFDIIHYAVKCDSRTCDRQSSVCSHNGCLRSSHCIPPFRKCQPVMLILLYSVPENCRETG